MYHHIPVMLDAVIESLMIRRQGTYVDGTLGGGGHSKAILSEGGIVYGIDRDMDAINASMLTLSQFPGFHPIHGNFHDMPALLKGQGIEKVDGVLLDLGVSSHQLDTPDRGFSYHADAPLDMRMDQTQSFTAAELLNTWSAPDIARILRSYGDEAWAARIASIVVEHRERAPLRTTGDLVRVVDAAIPRRIRDKDKGHSAQKTFQALRIAVNDELSTLDAALESAAHLLTPGGRICVITFHSIEDRVVKHAFRRMENPCTCPRELPVCVCGKLPSVRLPVRAIRPSPEEILSNPRARSAKLRVAEKL